MRHKTLATMCHKTEQHKLSNFPNSNPPKLHSDPAYSSMGLCVSMLKRKAKRWQPEPRRSTPKPLFIVRSDYRRPSKPEARLFQAQSSGQPQLQKPGCWADARKHDKCRYEVPDALDRMVCPSKLRLPCGSCSTCSAPVEPVAAEGRLPPMTGGRGAPPEGCRTPVAPPMTPMRPVWQRRILMGMRCELPRFSGLILYDEHGRPIRCSTPGRRNHHQGKKRTAKTSPTLRDLL